MVSFLTKTLRNAGGSNEPPHLRARNDAEASERAYRAAIRKLDQQRLGIEEKVEEGLRALQRWELDRLRAVKTGALPFLTSLLLLLMLTRVFFSIWYWSVLLQYQGTLSSLPAGLQTSNERSSTLLASYQPESDVVALIERYRTGPFRPTPHVFETVFHEEPDAVFGIDLRKWGGSGWTAARNGSIDESSKKEDMPSVVRGLLGALKEVYPKLPSDEGEWSFFFFGLEQDSSICL